MTHTRHLTMQAMADELGLSRLTVSSVINDRAQARGISSATEAKVRAHLLRRGYVRSRHALQLRGAIGERIGILYSGPLYSHLTDAFNRLTAGFMDRPDAFEIMVVPPPERRRGLQELIGRGVGRLIWFHRAYPAVELAAAEPLLPLLRRFRRVVVYNFCFDEGPWERRLLRDGVHLVGTDRAAGFRRLGLFLRRLGHRCVAFPDLDAGATDLPLLPLVGLKQAGLTVVETLRVPPADDLTEALGKAAARHLLGAWPRRRFTAACFNDDEVAAYAMAALRAAGVRLPEALTVTGLDDRPLAALLPVPLTTLRMPVDGMVRCVADLVRAERSGARRHCFPLTLVARQSHARAPRDLAAWC